MPKGDDGTNMIYVTQPVLPPLSEFIPYLEEIWRTKTLTNCGPFHDRLEAALCDYLGVSHISLFANGTLALVTALQALRINGEVITTPYSFVATSHSLLWNGIKPVFVDIDPDSLNLNPAMIEAAITPNTTAIMPVHCYGNPCDVEAIQKIADNYNLKVIYDAAHAFGVKRADGSLLKHGDLSVLSFHATKVFNTFEGGAIICPDAKTKRRIDHLKNFGFVNETSVVIPGINGKMNEVCAAMGVLQLQHGAASIKRRGEIADQYRNKISRMKGLRCINGGHEVVPNNSYFPILVLETFSMRRDELYEHLKRNGVYARRYFYPLISEFPLYRNIPSADPTNLPVATKAAQQILCLPIYPELSDSEVNKIIELIAAPRES